MNIIEDIFNNQFMMHDYLQNINTNLVQYITNNNFDLNYYCAYYKTVNNKHYIITSKTAKRLNNGHRLIVIKDNLDIISDNYIREVGTLIRINYENIIIKIHPINDSSTYPKLNLIIINPNIKCVSGFINYDNIYNCNSLEQNIISIINYVHDYQTLLHKFINLKNLNFIFFKKLNDLVIDDLTFPPKLNTLALHSKSTILIKPNSIPKTVRKLAFYTRVTTFENILPPNLHTITFGHSCCYKIDKGMLPLNLRAIYFNNYMEIVANALPPNLHLVSFNTVKPMTITKHMLPASLKKLYISGRAWPDINEGSLPDNLSLLALYSKWGTSIKENILPPNLKTLKFGHYYDYQINVGILPPKLRILQFGNGWATELLKESLPQTLKYIIFTLTSNYDNIRQKELVMRLIPLEYKYVVQFIFKNVARN
jgi:hypothetical protein